MMKTIALLIVSLFPFFCSTCTADTIIKPTSDDMVFQEAFDIAMREFSVMLDSEQEQVTVISQRAFFVTLSVNYMKTNAWVFTFFMDEDPRVATVTVQSPSGSILHKAFDFWWAFRTVWADWDNEHFYFWPAEKKALYSTLYEYTPTWLIPEEDAIPAEEAVQIA